MKFNLDNLVLEYDKLQEELLNPEIFKDQKKIRELSLRKKQLEESVLLYKEYKKAHEALAEATEILYNEKDEEIRELAKIQKNESEDLIGKLEEKIKISLLSKDDNDDKNIILEVRA
jgi:peptide chain release factor 1